MSSRNIVITIIVLFCVAVNTAAQSKVLSVGGIDLQIGMSKDVALKLITSKYEAIDFGNGNNFIVRKKEREGYRNLGSASFTENRLSYIAQKIDTTGWPNDEGYSVAMALFQAMNGAIPTTDSDGIKRSSASVLIQARDVPNPQGTHRCIYIYINEKRVQVDLLDLGGQKSVDVSISVKSGSW